jgi:hypothetical protein
MSEIKLVGLILPYEINDQKSGKKFWRNMYSDLKKYIDKTCSGYILCDKCDNPCEHKDNTKITYCITYPLKSNINFNLDTKKDIQKLLPDFLTLI